MFWLDFLGYHQSERLKWAKHDSVALDASARMTSSIVL